MFRKGLMGIAIAAVLLGGWGGYRYHVSARFAASYATYSVIADAHSRAAFVPAVDDNPLRQELNRTLARVLSDTGLDSEERLSLARHGLDLLREQERQIDDIEKAGVGVEAAISQMEKDASGPARTDITALARERFRIIADIRGLSYRANFHTTEIFDRVIQDGGKLTDTHVRELNDQIPQVEEQFDARTNLYSDLEQTDLDLSDSVAALGMF